MFCIDHSFPSKCFEGLQRGQFSKAQVHTHWKPPSIEPQPPLVKCRVYPLNRWLIDFSCLHSTLVFEIFSATKPLLLKISDADSFHATVIQENDSTWGTTQPHQCTRSSWLSLRLQSQEEHLNRKLPWGGALPNESVLTFPTNKNNRQHTQQLSTLDLLTPTKYSPKRQLPRHTAPP